MRSTYDYEIIESLDRDSLLITLGDERIPATRPKHAQILSHKEG